jgi:uncharacterized protein (DUF1501 family)
MRHTTNSSRRRFLGQMGALAGLAPLSASLDLLNLGRVAAADTPGDYKALVCVFLFGGNDSFNTIIPRDPAGYGTYALARRDLAVPQANLLALTDPNHADPLGRSFGLNPAMASLLPLFETERKLAVTLNVGPLMAPMNKQQFQSGQVQRPPNLESHDDQQFQTQTAGIYSKDNGFTGWNGRLADWFGAANSSASGFANISVSGYNVLQSGLQTLPFVVDSGNFSPSLSKYATADLQSRLLTGVRGSLVTSPHLFAQVYANTKTRALDGNAALAQALANVPLPAGFPASGLGQQLQAVARIMAVAPALGIRRQTFFCGISGFDTHADQNQAQPGLLGGLADALAAFYRYTQSAGLANNVTTFTASDFGRTFAMNGSLGTDHAWGGIQFVLGGAVQGGFYGAMPDQTLAGPDDMSTQGRFIPTTAIDQIAATLALWYGVSPADLAAITPRISYFASANLGFMG